MIRYRDDGPRRHPGAGRLQGLAFVLTLGAILAPGTGQSARESEAPGDDFGYRLLRGASGDCPYGFVDISATGTRLYPIAAGTAPAMDDGAAVLDLDRPLRLYGATLDRLVVSTNGYLAGVDGLDREDGGDFSNDCPIPAIPGIIPGDSGAVGGARIMAFHDDLTGTGADAALLAQSFADCPRSGISGAEPCTVVQWHRFAPVGHPGDRLELQAVLYHGTNDIVLQVADPDDSAAGGASIGIQDTDARIGLSLACNSAGAVPAGHAACFRYPRRRVTLDPAVSSIPFGGSQAMVATVSDPQGSPVAGVAVGIQVLEGPHAGLVSRGASDSAGRYALALRGNGAEGGLTDRLRAWAQDGDWTVESPLAAATWVGANPLSVLPTRVASRQNPGVQYSQVLVLTNGGKAPLGVRAVYGSADACQGETALGWLRIGAAAATIPAKGSIQLRVTLDSAALGAGDYPASICVVADPAYPATGIPVRLTVLAPDICARADIDGDRIVTAVDYRIVLTQLRRTVPPYTNGDTDGDGDVDGFDASLVRNCSGRVIP